MHQKRVETPKENQERGKMRKDRELIKLAKTNFGVRKITALEIGIFNGGNAVSILRNLKIKKLYLVDPYSEYDDYKNSSAAWGTTQQEYDILYNKVKKRMRKYGNKVELIREFSSKVQIDDTFDFIYLDGNYAEILDDFKKFYPLLNKDGIIGGYGFKPAHRQLVEDIFKIVDKYNLKLNGGCDEWWVQE